MRTLKEIKETLEEGKECTIKLTSVRGNQYDVQVVTKKYFNNILKFKTLKVHPHEVNGIDIWSVSYLENGKTKNYFVKIFGCGGNLLCRK